MKVCAEGIENGSIPVTAGPGDAAWDPDNPYRNLDAANKEAPVPAEPDAPDPALMTPAQKEIEKIKAAIGAPLDIPAPIATSTVRPSAMEIAMACNTFNYIVEGKIEELDKLPLVCKPPGNMIPRAIGLIPFMSRFDPWLEYLGSIRDR